MNPNFSRPVKIIIVDDNQTLLGAIAVKMTPSIYGRYFGDESLTPFNLTFNHNNVTALLISDYAYAHECLVRAFEDHENRIVLFSDHYIRNSQHNRSFRILHDRTMNGRSLPTHDNGAELAVRAIAHCLEHQQRLAVISISDDPESMIDQVKSKIDCAIDPALVQIEPLGKIPFTEKDRFRHGAENVDETGCNVTATAANIIKKLYSLMVDFGVTNSALRTSPRMLNEQTL
jgi:hypothetical protein